MDDHEDADSNPTNEIQSLSKSGNTITLSDGGSVTDENTTYTGADFVVSNQGCPNGQIITGFDATGNVICGTDEVDDADNDPTNEIETWATLGGIPAGFNDDIDDVNDADFDPSNEIQTLSKSGSTVTLSNSGGNFIDEVDDADNDPTNEIETWGTLSGKPAGFSDGIDDVNDADSNPSNEIQTLSKSGSTVTLSNSGGNFIDEVDDADNDPTNEDDSADGTTISGDGITTPFSVNHSNITPEWNNVQNMPAGFSDNIDNVIDGDASSSNEFNTSLTLSGTKLLLTDGGSTLIQDLASFYNHWQPATGQDINFLSGNVGIGESNPGNLLHIKGDGGSSTPLVNLEETGSATDGARMTFTNGNSSNRWTLYGLAHNTDATSLFNIYYNGFGNVMQLNGVGDVGIGGSPNSNLHIYHGSNAGNDGIRLENTGSNTNWMRFYVNNSSGNLTLYSKNQGSSSIGNFNDATGAYSATSDRRLKKNFKDLHFDWEKFMNLEPLTYSYKTEKGDQKYIGMVAQDVEKIYPEMVSYQEEEDVYHMDYSGFGVIAVKAVQELKKENEALRKELELLKLAQQNFAEMSNSQSELIKNQQKLLEAFSAQLERASGEAIDGGVGNEVEEKK